MNWITPTLALLAIVGGMYFLTHLLRTRLGVGAGTVSPKALKVVGRRQLEQRKSLYVVEIADRYVLVGTGESSVSFIDHITADEFARMTEEPVVAKDDAGDDGGDADGDSAGTEAERFATVAESFQLLLGKARSSRRKAASDEAPQFELVGADAPEQER